jgi:hypothetical protein
MGWGMGPRTPLWGALSSSDRVFHGAFADGRARDGEGVVDLGAGGGVGVVWHGCVAAPVQTVEAVDLVGPVPGVAHVSVVEVEEVQA